MYMCKIEERLFEIERRLNEIQMFLKAKDHQYLLRIFDYQFLVDNDMVMYHFKTKIENGKDIDEGYLEYH